MNALKLGLMVPGNNTTMEREFPAWMPAGSTCCTLKIPRGEGMLDAGTVAAYRASALALAQGFAGGGFDAIAFGCTAAGFLSGPAADAAFAADLEVVTGRPVVTTAQAMVLALQASGAARIAVVTPYLDLVNDRLSAFLAASGIAVRHLKSFRAATVDELALIESPAVARLARDCMRDNCDAMFIACSQLPTRDIVEPLQREFGRPVWSSIQATAWRTRQALAA